MRTFIKQSTHLGMMDTGWGNGYVVIPKGHKLHGKGYDEISDLANIDINGGLTFASSIDNLDLDFWSEIMPEDANGWVVGFDTAHYGDTLANWPEREVMREAEYLKEQLLEYEPI